MVSKSDRKRSDAAIEAFHKYYASPKLWNADRWDKSLFAALSRPVRYARLNNPHTDAGLLQDGFVDVQLPNILTADAESGVFLKGRVTTLAESATERSDTACAVEQKASIPPPALSSSIQVPPVKLLSHYNLDAASLLPVVLLDPQPGDRILDMCASPGGKSIAIGQTLFSSDETGSLHSNESHPARHARLAKNLTLYFPPHLLNGGSIQALKLDASSMEFSAKLPAHTSRRGYDKVLLDTPCSSERHVIHSHLAAQRSGGISSDMVGFRTGVPGKKAIVKLQTDLLMNALRVCRIGGTVVYSTCSIDRIENEGVVKSVMDRLNKGKEGFGAQLVDMDELVAGLDDWSEMCEVGRICLPDHGKDSNGHGWGPIYFCKLVKMPIC
ncbi:25S rRNA (cytosine-C(5))-methyltransferase nop2 [Sphaceloma murrayae]|uniref:NOL1/NOP2/Sun domain family member 4 n=1 Tax=Sphaceloma murrayae TaxID=2082308 RepID=A0A2K1QRX5_9PEZI|nr:25S rRNA (cytosine-C(5))-methyltransferase nop2 [Sphaceloma murrayae]